MIYSKIVMLFFALSLLSCKTKTKNNEIKQRIPFVIVLHGGAGNITPENFSTTQQNMYKQVLNKALEKGYMVLEKGGTSVEAVQKAISILEDSPLFNAGRGAVFDSDGKNSLDASIMDGKSFNAGAVAGVHNIKNPIVLAKMIMDRSKHVLLSGIGAEKFAEQHQIQFKNDAYFYTKRQADYLKKVQKQERMESLKSSVGNLQHSALDTKKNSSASKIKKPKFKKYGTVGCVALDKNGNIAAGTSTGGLTNKKFDRIGDSPLIGAGTYANNTTCGVSCTGVGEYFIRTLAAHEVSNLIKYNHLSAKEAVKEVIHTQIDTLGGVGGMIVLDSKGYIAWDFNTDGMFRAFKKSTGESKIALFSKDKVMQSHQ